jgi:hypothetical protein
MKQRYLGVLCPFQLKKYIIINDVLMFWIIPTIVVVWPASSPLSVSCGYEF